MIKVRTRLRPVTKLVRVKLKISGYPGNPCVSHHGDVIS